MTSSNKPELKTLEISRLHEDVTSGVASPSYYRRVVEEAMQYIKVPPRGATTLLPGVVEFLGDENYVFIGDIHGDYYTLLKILDKYWELPEDYIFVFLGDYIDRGYMQIETLTLLLKLKITYPQRLLLLRGNHEPPRWLIPHPHDYPYVLRSRYGSEYSTLYELTLDLFEEIPISAVKRRLFLALHGGPPLRVLSARSIEEAFSYGSKQDYYELLEEVLWSDPDEYIDMYIASPRGAGVLYGKRVSSRAIELIGGGVIIRGHEAVNRVERTHNGLVYTVFTSPRVYELPCGGVLVFRKIQGEYKVEEICIT